MKPTFFPRALLGTFCLAALIVCQIGAPTPAQAAKSPLLKQMSDEISELAEDTRGAVVRIMTTSQVDEAQQGDPFERLEELFGPRFAPPRQRGPRPPVYGLGSGFIIDKNGTIMTNTHVVKGAEQLEVILDDGRRFDAELVGADDDSEVAVIKIDADNLETIDLGDSADTRVGDFVLTIGSPQGLSQSVSFGIVSALNRSEVRITEFSDFIQTDAAINRGNSGGPLLDVEGRAIGVCTAIISTSGGSQGLGLAIPINQAKIVADALIKYGEMRRGFLGVNLQDLTPEIGEHLGTDDAKGAVVAQVFPGTPADGELLTNDAIIALDGEEPNDMMHLREMIASHQPGDTVRLTVVRDGERRSVRIKLGERPDRSEIASLGSGEPVEEGEVKTEDLDLGFSVKALTPELAENAGYSAEQQGLLVTKVDPSSDAYRRGLRPGSVIETVNGEPVVDVEGMQKAVKAGEGKSTILLLVRDRQGTGLMVLPRD